MWLDHCRERPAAWLLAGGALLAVAGMIGLDQLMESTAPTERSPASRAAPSPRDETAQAVRVAALATSRLAELDDAGRVAWLSGFALDPPSVAPSAARWAAGVRALQARRPVRVRTIGYRTLAGSGSESRVQVVLWQEGRPADGGPVTWLLTPVSLQRSGGTWLVASVGGVRRGPAPDALSSAIYPPVP